MLHKVAIRAVNQFRIAPTDLSQDAFFLCSVRLPYVYLVPRPAGPSATLLTGLTELRL